MKPEFNVGDCFNCPIEVADSGQLIVVGVEANTRSPRMVIRGRGEWVYHTCEAKDGQRISGSPSFCVGSDEALKWQEELAK